MPIKVLAPGVISQIAAGEVIENPASVVKELVENSLDAGASQIKVEVQGGGIELIGVVDDGAGISAAEVELAFQRHATSKITDVDDLSSTSTLGFRGEALSSIAAAAEVELYTQAASEVVGSRIRLSQGKVVRQESRSRPRGTTVTMRWLFRHLPARLKFLKSASREESRIVHLLTQYALAFPEVKFRLLVDQHLNFETTGDGSLRGVVACLYGREMAQKMLVIEGEGTTPALSGLLSPPSLTRSNRSYISIFVNRRWVRSPLLIKATEVAYRGLLMEGRHPIAVINLALPSADVDVNVHPAKAQVRFRDEQMLFSMVQESLRAVLSQVPIATEKTVPFTTSSRQGESSWEVHDREASVIAPLPTIELPVLRVLGQLSNTYIIAEGPDGLYLVDQHAAHERIRYERILAQWKRQEVEVQGLLSPVTVELNPRQEATLKSNRELLVQFGFSLEPFGSRSYLMRAVPVLIANTNVVEAITTLLDNLAAREDPVPWQEKIARTLACHSAIRGGQQLSREEMGELIRQLERAEQPRTCPHGRPTMIHLTSHQIEKEFGRIV
jgi:DNA mismatch repair protein MutL